MKCLKFPLLCGTAIGLMAGSAPNSIAQTQPSQQVEEIHPSLATSSIASNTMIAHRVAADQFIVSGYDLGKLLEGLMNAIGNSPTGSVSRVELQQILENARPDKTLKLVLPETPHPHQTPQPQPQEPNK